MSVLINGAPASDITPLRPTLWLGRVDRGDRLTLVVPRLWGESVGHAWLLVGKEIRGWTVRHQGIAELRRAAASARFEEGAFPIRVGADGGVWLSIPERRLAQAVCSMNTVVRCTGEGLHLTAFTDEHCLGRMVLGGLPGTRFAGGRGDLFIVPQGEGDLLLYVEATRAEGGCLRSIALGGPVDRA